MTSLHECNTPSYFLSFLNHFIDHNENLDSFSTFTLAIYDTAWFSMVHRSSPNGYVEWLFPSCWDYILETQLNEGPRPSYSAPIDGILNTLASLLALFTRKKNLDAQSDLASFLGTRIASATQGLRNF
ncbi:hypothetical protein CC80DRAFT_545402 [Byssothecium circinans]|uniref:Uncharacterized protein n=1 Tax=Byssothecium circinans TaxID=147558 RepID=A0A6A5UFV6_9PLEO|nr:hypothetical protein CC80DRAFT_545402 [Byssothecium circinans]